jgi:tRNA threonylcarbamoyladenosine biosynthesis protein TsaB
VDCERVIAALDARMGEIYWGAYERSAQGLVQMRVEECVCAPDKAPRLKGDAWVGAGSGWKAYADSLNQVYKESVSHCLDNVFPHAAAVALLGEAAIAGGKTVTPEQALPVYLRDEVTWKKIR